MKMSLIPLSLVLLAGWLADETPAFAATRTWDGSANGLLSNGANWVGGVAPVNGDSLVFPASGVSRFLVTNNIIGGPHFPTITFLGNGYTLSGAFIVTSRLGAENVAGVNRVSCALQLNANATIYINGAAGALFDIDGNVTMGANTLSVSAGGGSLFLGGVLSGTGGINKISGGTVRFDGTGANTYTGLTTVFGGTLELFKGPANTLAVPGDLTISGAADVVRLLRDNQLASATDVIIGAGGRLDLQNFRTPVGTLTLNGGQVTGGTLVLNGNVTATSDPASVATISGNLDIGIGPRTFAITDNPLTALDLDISAAISGLGGIIKNGAGTLAMSGSASNTFMGATRLNEGTLLLRRAFFDRSVPGNLFIGDGIGGAGSDVVRLENFAQIHNQSVVVIASSGLLDLNGISEAIGSLAGEGRVFVGPNSLGVGINGASTTYSGQISGSGGLTKMGLGTMTLTANNTYQGPTLVVDGALLVNGVQTRSAINATGGTLGGTGVVGHVVVAGGLRPGTSPGLLTGSNLTFNSLGNYFVELNGTAPGVDYDQMNVRGSVAVTGSRLHVLGAFSSSPGQRFTIIDNDQTDAVAGAFLGLPEGAAFPSPVGNLRVSYQGGDGNDVVLTRVGALTTAFGLQHVGLEQATLTLGPAGELIVDNLAPTGNAGVLIPLGGAQGWQGRFTALDPQSGRGRLQWELQGQLGQRAFQPLLRGSMEVVGGEILAFADSSLMGATAHWVEAYAGDVFLQNALVSSNTPLFRLLPPFPHPPATTLRCEGPLPGRPYWSCDISWTEPCRLQLPGTNSLPLEGVTRVRVRPWEARLLAQVGSPSALQLTGRDLSEIRLADEALLFPPDPIDEGLPHRALGQAQLSVPVPEDGKFVVAHIGSQPVPEDGVSIDAQHRSSGMGIRIMPVSLTLAGTAITLSAVGTFDHQPNRSMGTAGLHRVGGALQAMADFTPVGSALVRVEVFRGGTLVGNALVPPGVVATASAGADLPGLDAVGWIPPCYLPVIVGIAQTDPEPLSCYFFHFDKLAAFTTADGGQFVGDSLRLLQASVQPRAQSLARLDIRASLPGSNSSLTLLGEKLRLPAPQVTRIFPQQTRAGEIVEIRGRGFGSDPSDIGVVGSARASGLDQPTVPFRVLSASDTRILARVGNLPPGTPGGPILVSRGAGASATTLSGISPDVELLQPIRGFRESTPAGSWQDDSVSPPVRAVQVYTPAKFQLPERCFYSEPAGDGVISLYIYDWRPNAVVSFSSHLAAEFQEGGVSLDAAAVRFVGGADILEGAEKLADVLEAAFLQLVGLVVNVEASRPQDGTAKLTLSLPHGAITGGFLNVCVRSSSIEMSVTDVHPPTLTDGKLVTIKGRGFGDDTRDLRLGLRDTNSASSFPLDVLRATETQIVARMGPAPPEFRQGPMEILRGEGVHVAPANPSNNGLHRIWRDGIAAAIAPNLEHEFINLAHCFYSRNNAEFSWPAPSDGPPYLDINAFWNLAVSSVTVRAVVLGPFGATQTIEATLTRDVDIWLAYDFAEALEDALFLQAGIDSAVIVDLLPQEPGAVQLARLIPYILPTEFADLGSFSICIHSVWPTVNSHSQEDEGRMARIMGGGFGTATEDLSVAMLDGGGTRLIPLEVLDASDAVITARWGAVPPNAQPGPIVVTRGQGSFNRLQPFFDDITVGSGGWAWFGRGPSNFTAQPITPVPTQSEPGRRWFFSDPPRGGHLSVVLTGDWPSGAIASIIAGIHDTNGAAFELRVPTVRFTQAGNLVECAERLADVIRSGYWQQAALAVDVRITGLPDGSVRLAASLGDGPIARGYLNIGVTEAPVITALQSGRGGPGDVVTINGRGFGTKPENLLVYVEGKNGGPVLFPVLSVTETQLVAVVGIVRPEAQAGPIVVARGDGSRLQKTAPGISGMGLQQWFPRGDVLTRSSEPFEPLPPPPTFERVCFNSVETNGVIEVEVEGHWPSNVRAFLEMSFSSIPPDPLAPDYSVALQGYLDLPGGPAQDCAQVICGAFDGRPFDGIAGNLQCVVSPVGVDRFKLTFSSNVPIYGVFNICYNRPILFAGVGVTAAGLRARIAPLSDGRLSVTNIGSSGLDGLRWDLGESQGANWDLGVPAVLPAAARLVLEASGRPSGPLALGAGAGQPAGPSTLVQRTTLEWLGADLRITFDPSPSGATHYQRNLFRDGMLVHQQTGLSGVAAVVRGPTGLIRSSCFVGPIGCSFQFPGPLAMALGDGIVVQADTLILLPEDPLLEAESLSGLTMLGANLPEFTIAHFSMRPRLSIQWSDGNVAVSWTGTGTLEVADVPTGPWRDVLPAPAGNPHLQPAGDGAKFFRLRE